MKSKFSDAKYLKELNNEELFTVLCHGVHHPDDVSHLKDLFTDTTTVYSSIFDIKPFIENQNISDENPDGVNLLEYILPSVKRVYSKFFINPPGLLNNERLDLYRLQFNLEEFLIFLKDKFIENQKSLDNFKYLDTNSEILTLIVEDYVASKIAYIASVKMSTIKEEIRDIKISKHLKL
jgi:hypothetical protein